MATKRNPALHVDEDLSDLFGSATESERGAKGRKKSTKAVTIGMPIERALEIVITQMQTSGLRPRTISDYELHVKHFIKTTEIKMLGDAKATHVYEWLASMDVSPQTKLTRLKCIKAFFERCADNSWISARFWRQITIKVDTPVKEGTAEEDIYALLRLLDLSDYVQLRDATAVLLMYQTGLRLGSVSVLEERHIDLETRTIRLEGALLKNRESIVLPFDERLGKLLKTLISHNQIVRKIHNEHNSFVFMTRQGTKIATSFTSNNIGKRLNLYKRKYGLKNMSPHALRRGFAKDIYNRSGGDLALVSKALGHSDFGVTARYLHLSPEEVADKLRKYR